MKKLVALSFVLIVLAFFSCKKENQEVLNFEHSLCSKDTISYQDHIKVLIENNCLPCHSTAQQNAGIVLDNYADASNYALNGLIYGTISYQPGYTPMPSNGPQLDSCSIRAVQLWANQGAPNN